MNPAAAPIIALSLLASLPCLAQASISFTVIGWGTDSNDLGYRHNSKEIPLRIQNFRRSEVYPYSGPATMSLYRYANEAPPSDKSSHKAIPVEGGLAGEVEYMPEEYTPPSGPLGTEPVGKVTLPANCSRVVLLVARNGEKAQIFALPEDMTKSPAGKVRFVNLTNTKIGVKDSRNSHSVIPSQKDIVLSPNAEDSTLLARIAYEKDGKWPMLKDAMFAAPDNVQTTVIFLRSDDDSFRSMDGQVLGPIQMYVMRIPDKRTEPARQ
jgi:hypothetical protein